MRILFISLVSLTLILISCQKKNVPAKEEFPLYETPEKPIAICKLKRGGCFGKCPIYDVSFMSNGTVIYKGMNHVPKTGEFTAQATIAQINSIIRKANELKVWDMNDYYPDEFREIQDAPVTTVELKVKDQVKVVKEKMRTPKELKEFHKFIDDLTNELFELNVNETK